MLIPSLIVIFAILTGLRPAVSDMDFGWQVAQGRWMVQHHAVYRQDVLNYPNLGQPVIDEYPLFQLVAYWSHSLDAFGPSLLCALGYGLLFILLLVGESELKTRPAFLFLAATGMTLFFLQMSLRPHLVTYLCLVAFAIFILRHRDASTVLEFWPLALLEVIWVNCHSGFIIGPLLVWLFGFEMTVRSWWKAGRFPTQTCCVWGGAFCLIALACFINPYGASRITLPFFQETSGVIRAYVAEMQPLSPPAQTLFIYQAIVAALLILLSIFIQRGQVSWSWLLLTLGFYVKSLSASKHWALFGLMVPILVLSSAAFRSAEKQTTPSFALLGLLTETAVLIFLAMGLILRLGPGTGLASAWQVYHHHRSDLPQSATAWMTAHQVHGRLLHRGEDGGWLQAEGFANAETFCDAGLGKFSPDFIREIGLLGARPGFIVHQITQHQPDFALCGSLAYAWPAYLRQQGWRPIFYAQDGSVWTRTDVRPDLPTLTVDEINTEFERENAALGVPADPIWYARAVLGLHACGARDAAVAAWQAMPPAAHRSGYYWDCARMLCFDEPTPDLSAAALFMAEIPQLPDPTVAADFQAYALHAEGKTDEALGFLQKMPSPLRDPSALLLLKLLYQAQRWNEAQLLVRRTDCFDANDGERDMYQALIAEHFGRDAEAASAWKNAIYFAPDSLAVQGGADTFAKRTGNLELTHEIDRAR